MPRCTRALVGASLFLTILASPSVAQSGDQVFDVVGSDGFVLEGRIALPAADSLVERIVVLLHGSGPQSMDEDLSTVTRDGKQNLFFRDLSDALSPAGFAVLRYNKRSYQSNLRRQRDPTFAGSEIFVAYAANPLKYFVDDAMAAVRDVEKRFPDADIYLLGHSQGSYIALQVAREMPQVKGVALIGFALSSTDVLIFEQTVYRPLPLFGALDTNMDDVLDSTELGADDPVANSLRSQMAIIDLDTDGMLSEMEFQAGNLSNLMLSDGAGILREQEARYPRPAEILAAATFKVAFFQGMWDNQTPAYNTQAVELVARHVWGKDAFRFFYFDGLGHALDARTGYGDLRFDTIDPGAKETIVRELDSFF